MGSMIGKQMQGAMEDNMKKNQEFMLATQKMQMERQMHMQILMQQKAMSSQIAKAREMFDWLGSFYVLASLGMFIGYTKGKNPAVLFPFLPLTFVVGYQAHLAYGNKIKKIRGEAERILSEEKDLLALPLGPLTFEEVDNARLANKNK